MASKLNVYPEYPPRVRVEWLIAISRVLIAGGALIAVAMTAPGRADRWVLTYTLGWYLIYSLLLVGLVWTPVRFARGWDLAQHAFDLAAFSLFMLFAESPESPFFVYFIFLVIVGALRWEVQGAIWSAVVTIAVYAAVSAYAVIVLRLPSFAMHTFVIRAVYLVVVGALLAYLSAYQNQFQREINRVVSWPRRLPREPRDLAGEIVTQSAEILEAPRVLLVWEEPDEGDVNLAWGSGGEISWATEPEATYGSFVVPGYEHKSLQAADVTDDNGRVIYWVNGSFRRRYGRPINPALQARFGMRAVQSWSLDGELVRGRLFVLDKPRMRIDDLIVGEVVARLAVSRLDSTYLLRHLNQAAAFEERLRVARDLHDSLLQTIAGTALQLVAARRLLDRDPTPARVRLEEVQNQLEHGELEMRSFIRRLRPAATPEAAVPKLGLRERLEELRRRVDRQWEVNVKLHLEPESDRWPEALAEDVYRIVQEGVLNAAKHADASVIAVDFATTADSVRVQISDDGCGFPFHGKYNLWTLNEMKQGPWTLKERVAALRGDLTLQTADTGTELLITLPLAPVAS
jgi:signal transduction histidine kinase